MNADDVVLLVFCFMPIAAAGAMLWFFRRGRTRSLARLVAGNVLVLAFLLSLVLVGGEVWYRYFHDSTDSFGLTKTTARWFERHFHRNRHGYRDNVAAYSAAIAPGKRRITFLGDSFTAGHGVRNVEERFANLVRQARPGCEVHVLARNGWETGNHLDLVRRLQPDYALDQVVLVYCLNDISDLIPEWQEAVRNMYESNRPRHVLAHSYFLNTLYFRLGAARNPDVANYFHRAVDAYKGRPWQQQESRLRELAQRVKSRGGRLSVLTFPFLHNLGRDYPFESVHRQLARLWQSAEVDHLDLLDVYRPKASETLVVSPHDAHPNERAHRLAADVLLPFLDRQMRR